MNDTVDLLLFAQANVPNVHKHAFYIFYAIISEFKHEHLQSTLSEK